MIQDGPRSSPSRRAIRVVAAVVLVLVGRRGGVPAASASGGGQALHGHADPEDDEETTEYKRVVPRSHLQCATELVAARGHGECQADDHEGAPGQQVGRGSRPTLRSGGRLRQPGSGTSLGVTCGFLSRRDGDDSAAGRRAAA